jgi:hypothetical protein
MLPKSEDDLLFKLGQKFTGHKDLLNFFEANREIFGTSDKSFLCYRDLFKRLLGFDLANKKDSVNITGEA